MYLLPGDGGRTRRIDVDAIGMAYSTNPDDDCYCHLWDDDPDWMRSRGIPDGYCGLCDTTVGGERCGKPGHLRQGNGPYSFCSCEEHAKARPLHIVRRQHRFDGEPRDP